MAQNAIKIDSKAVKPEVEKPKVTVKKTEKKSGWDPKYSPLNFNQLMEQIGARGLQGKASGFTDTEKGRRELRKILKADDNKPRVRINLRTALLVALGVALIIATTWGGIAISKTNGRVDSVETGLTNLQTSVRKGFEDIKGLLSPDSEATSDPVADEPAETVVDNPVTDKSTATNDPAPAGIAVAACPTDAQMWSMVALPENVKPVFHGESISWDPCQWQWQAYATEMSITLPLPQDWVATVTLSDGTVAAYRGTEGLTVDNVAGFNLRYVPAYPEEHWVRNDCAYLAQEYAFGIRRDPAYVTVSGNLVCEDLIQYNGGCPTTSEQVAALIGGLPSQWTEPDWEGGAWVFKAAEGEFILLNIPASLNPEGFVVKLDYWDGAKNAAASLLPGQSGISLNEASFHCHLPTE